MKNYLLTLPAIALLAACGGGGGSGTSNAIEDQPGFEDASEEEREDAEVARDDQSETDNDTSGDSGNGSTPATYEPPIPVGTAVALADAKVIDIQRRNASDTLFSATELVPAQGNVSLTATLNADGSITLSDGARSVNLTAGSDGNFQGSAGTPGDEATEIAGFLRPRSTAVDDVNTVFITFTDYNTRREGNIVVGIQTDAATANSLTGSAVYRGLMNARMTGPNGPVRLDAFGGGRLEMNFDAGTVSGSFNLTDPSGPLFEAAGDDQFPRVLVELNETTITDGGFDGTVDVTFKDGGGLGNPDLAFSNGTYDGALYGDTGAAAGGTFIGDVTNGDETLILQGAFSVD